MKNNNLKESNPVYIQEAVYSNDDEISLTDLAIILIRRRRLISIIVICFIALGVATALLITKKYAYSTSLEIGSQLISGSVEYFESPETLLAKLQHGFIPQTLNNHLADQKDRKKYKINADIPKDSVIVVLKTKGTVEESAVASKLLTNIINKAIQDHKRIYDAVKNNLIAQKNHTELELAALDTTLENVDEKELLLRSKLTALESQLANLRSTRVIVPPLKSIEPVSISRTLLVIAVAVISTFLAIITAFIAEFISTVKERDRENNLS